MARYAALRIQICAAVLALVSLSHGSAQAATYPPKFFLINAHLGYESVNPTEMNARLSNLANLNGMIASRLRAERGLIYPDWSHWIEVGFLINDISNRDILDGFDSDLKQSLWYLSVIPLGATFWFFKSAFVDFGASFGLGAALAMTYTSSITRVSTGAVTASGNFSNPFAPIVDAKVHARLWFAKYWALDGLAGMRFLSTSLRDPSGATFNANLLSFSIIFGATYAFGGYKGVGRTYAEVLKSGTSQNPATPTAPEAATPAAASPKVAPAPSNTPPPATPSAPAVKSRVVPGVVR